MYATQTSQAVKTVIVAIAIMINVIIVAIKIQQCAKNAHTKKMKVRQNEKHKKKTFKQSLS